MSWAETARFWTVKLDSRSYSLYPYCNWLSRKAVNCKLNLASREKCSMDRFSCKVINLACKVRQYR